MRHRLLLALQFIECDAAVPPYFATVEFSSPDLFDEERARHVQVRRGIPCRQLRRLWKQGDWLAPGHRAQQLGEELRLLLG